VRNHCALCVPGLDGKCKRALNKMKHLPTITQVHVKLLNWRVQLLQFELGGPHYMQAHFFLSHITRSTCNSNCNSCTLQFKSFKWTWVIVGKCFILFKARLHLPSKPGTHRAVLKAVGALGHCLYWGHKMNKIPEFQDKLLTTAQQNV